MDQVTVYTTPTCPWCGKLKEFLGEKGVSYNEIDITKDFAGARQMIEQTGQRSVPVTVVGGRTIVGYDREELERALV